MESFKAFFQTVSEDQWQLLNAYGDVLTFWNEKINLVSRKDIAFVKEAILSADGKRESEKLEIAEKVVDILTKKYRR